MPKLHEALAPPILPAHWGQVVPERSSISHPRYDDLIALQSEEIVGQSAQIQAIKQCIDRVAPTEATVLITGETGTGKELFARRLHRMSARKDGALVSINCAAIPETLIESELFGFEKGTFTGAASRQEGRLLQANGGTLFLDEVGDLSPAAQAKILRVLEDKEVRPLGSRSVRSMDARVVAATNRSVKQLGGSQSFRLDLFFRLSVVHLHIPPLRERQEDIPLLANHFLQRLSMQYDRPLATLTPAAREYLKRQAWRGNVRELKNVLERALLFCNSAKITEHDVAQICNGTNCWQMEPVPEVSSAFETHTQTERTSPRSRKVACSDESEREELRNALEQTQWNKTKTAEMLHWSRMTIYRKMVQYDIRPPGDDAAHIDCSS